ncbi:MAG TPA: reverse transcriptase/maturase family protein [Candidatus Colwellbacteria bacterium]|nr:reverse transcriptase/maturase family protein [Candidatus Colwellbacteria bacterium]
MTLFERITDFRNLHRAYLNARHCKRYRFSILKFGHRLEENLLALQRELESKTYRHGSYREFIVSDSKKRTIRAAPFRDRVVHHAVCGIIEPIFDKGFVYDSYACRRGKGTHAAVRRLESFLRSLKTKARGRRVYCLKCDVSKYFDNVDHELIAEIFRRKIPDEDVLWLLGEILESHKPGIPIGNLTSQIFANIYLNELDYFVKRNLREKYYLRYMDDFLVLGLDKGRLHESKELIREFLRDRLRLELHPKKAEVFPTDKGVDFLGYVIRGNKRFLRKSTVKRFLKKKRRLEAMVRNDLLSEESWENSRASWRGYAKFADAYKLLEKLGQPF